MVCSFIMHCIYEDDDIETADKYIHVDSIFNRVRWISPLSYDLTIQDNTVYNQVSQTVNEPCQRF